MARKKVKLAFMASESARKATYKKRKNGMVKKISELVTLCGVEACMIIYNPNEPEPVVWPSSRAVQGTISKYRKMPELEKCKKMLNLMSFTRERIQKVSEAIKKARKSNKEKELTHVMYHYMTNGIFQNMTANDLNDMKCLIDQLLRDVNKRVKAMDKDEPPQNNAMEIQGEGQQAQTNMDINIRTLQGQENFMEMMNYAGEGTLPIEEANIYNAWPGPFYF